MADENEDLKLRLILETQEATAELKKFRAQAQKPVAVGGGGGGGGGTAGPGRREYNQQRKYEAERRRYEAEQQRNVGPGRHELAGQKASDKAAAQRQAGAERSQARAKSAARQYEKTAASDQAKALGKIPWAKAAKETDKAAKSTGNLNNMLLRLVGGGGKGGSVGRLLGGLEGGGAGGGGAGFAALAAAFAIATKVIEVTGHTFQKATNVLERGLAYGRHGADVLNPRGAATTQLNKDLFQMQVGRPFLLAQRLEANLYEKGAGLAANLDARRNRTLALAGGGGWNNWQWLSKVPGGKTLQNLVNKAPALQAGFGEGQRFGSMADWHAEMTRANLGLGPGDREKLRQQQEASMKEWQAPQAARGGGMLDREDMAMKIVDAVKMLPLEIATAIVRAVKGF